MLGLCGGTRPVCWLRTARARPIGCRHDICSVCGTVCHQALSPLSKWSAQGMGLQIQSVATGSGMVGQSGRRLLDFAPMNLTDPSASYNILNQAVNSFLGQYLIIGTPDLPQVLPHRLHSQLRCL